MIFLLDPGHGIDTPGKRSPDYSFREYLWNREVAELVYALMKEEGMSVQYVVTETNDISLKTRVRRVNEVCKREGSRNVALLSIHANAAGNGDWMNAQGWSCYTSRGQTGGDKLADCLYEAFEEDFKDRKIRYDWSDGDADWEKDFYVCRNTSCPATLIENFFYDNREECAWLLLPETKERIARAIVKGAKLYAERFA